MNQPIRPRPASAPTQDTLAQASLADSEDVTNEGTSPDEAAPKLMPLERWRAGLKQANVTEDEANRILDDIVTVGFYAKDFKLFHGRIRVQFRTRGSATLRRIADQIDQLRSNDPRVHQQVMARIMLIDSLARYNDTALPHPGPNATSEEVLRAFQTRAAIVDGFGEHIFDALQKALMKFDAQVYAVSSEGDAEGF